MITTVSITKKDQESVARKYLKFPIRFSAEYSSDSEDGIEFFSFYTWKGNFVQWRIQSNAPMFFSITKGKMCYEICYPEKELRKKLEEISLKIRVKALKV